MPRLIWLIAVAAACAGRDFASRAAFGEPPAAVDFRRDVYPLLAARCFRCHEGTQPESGLRLDQRAGWLAEWEGHAPAVSGQGAKSRAVQLVSGQIADRAMPPEGPRLVAAEMGLLRRWIDAGLPWDDALLPPSNGQDHWAFRPLRRPELPPAAGAKDLQNPIDRLLDARQRAAGLVPAKEADRRTLIRRVALDLTGLPPDPAEVEEFVDDPAADAYERLVDRYLASPRYGERWARHWLDLARFAESEGYESNHPRPHAWRYRDWVVEAFNADLPYDQFLREQIAGDELLPYDDRRLVATGFLAAARLSSNEEDKWLQRNETLVDIANAVGATVLGLTVQCAQCHDHKFDPLTQRDYYRLLGCFVRGQPLNAALRDEPRTQAWRAALPPEYEPAQKLLETLVEQTRRRKRDEILAGFSAEDRRIAATPSDRRTWEEEQRFRQLDLKLHLTPNGVERALRDEDRPLYNELKKRIAALEKQVSPRPQAWAFYSPVTSPTPVEVLPSLGFYPLPYEPDELARARPHLLIRGEVHRRGEAVGLGGPEFLGGVEWPADTARPRTALAEWLVAPQNPLPARVWVNRLWRWHFGRGLAATTSNLGVRGARPAAPEVIDWLASELIAGGWSTKRIQRLIVTSQAFRRSVEADPETHRRDPQNRWLARWQPRRLEAEAIRDLLLATAGDLDPAAGGPSVPEAERETSRRRSLYLAQVRDRPEQIASLFDGPVAMAASCAERETTTTALQPLYLLNHPFAVERAAVLAARVAAAAGADETARVECAFRFVLGRPPTAAERSAALEFVRRPEAGEAAGRWAFLCQSLMNLNEFVYLF